MKNKYYVIVDKETLNFMNQGSIENIENAEKFNTYNEAKLELNEYDDDFKGLIYQVEENIYRDFKLIEE